MCDPHLVLISILYERSIRSRPTWASFVKVEVGDKFSVVDFDDYYIMDVSLDVSYQIETCERWSAFWSHF
jgi:hypothetical protein